jgi:mono/diheme cytochrome c family protein
MGNQYNSVGRGKQALAAAIIGLSGFLPTVASAAGQFDRGQALYENHCRSCHETGAHTRKDHRAKSIEDIRSRVAAWSIHSGLGWGPEEIEDVTRYLNRRFYQLD